MPSAQIIGSQVTITGLGKMSVSTKERDAIHVVLGKKAALESVSDAYYKHPRGIRLLADEQGQVEVDGVHLFGGFSLSSRADKPAVFEVRRSRRSKRRPTKFSGVLTEGG
ncbi:MAG: hypothetical protein AAB492_02365 [Patescibacteria group bacterium]